MLLTYPNSTFRLPNVLRITRLAHHGVDCIRRRGLLWDKDIQILQADKGNATVVLDADDYESKAHDLLDDTTSYQVLKKDPTQATERKLLTRLRDLR